MRSALIWTGMGDCRGDVNAMRVEDPEKAELLEIIEAMPAGRFTTREIGNRVAVDPGMREVLEGFIGRGGAFSTRRFGRYLLRHVRSRVAGRWIEQVESDGKHGAVWKICCDDAE